MRIEAGILLGLPGMAARARKLRKVRTREIRRLKRDEPDLDWMVGSHGHWELTVHREVLHAVRYVLFGEGEP